MEFVSVSSEKWLEMLEKHDEWARELNVGQAGSDDMRRIRLVHHHIKGGEIYVKGKMISSIELVGCLIENITFIDCYFGGSYFLGSVLDRCTFQKCDFRKAELEHGSYVGTDFSQSSFMKVSFRGSVLLNTNFSDADLTGTDFDEVDLRFSNLQNTTLIHTYFSDTRLFSNHRFQTKLMKDVYIKNVTFHFTGRGEKYSDEEAIEKIFYASPEPEA